jgi:hypothetical protein
VHEVPADLKKALTSDPQALTAWEDALRQNPSFFFWNVRRS